MAISKIVVLWCCKIHIKTYNSTPAPKAPKERITHTGADGAEAKISAHRENMKILKKWGQNVAGFLKNREKILNFFSRNILSLNN